MKTNAITTTANGVPMRFFNQRLQDEETVYLATTRTGELGEKLRAARGAWHDAQEKIRRVLRDAVLLSQGVSDATPVETLRELAARQDLLNAEAARLGTVAEEAAELHAMLALEACHGADEARRIMDCLTDRQVQQCIRLVELGEEPADFFDGRAIRPSGAGTGLAAVTSGGTSLPPGTGAAT
jgi:hypothetical protein